MGAIRHRELIRVLSVVVALDMTIGVVALAVRSGDRSEYTTQYAGSTGIPLDTKNGSVLAGGSFNSRRNSGNSSATAAPATSATTAPVAPPTSAAPTPTSGPAAITPSTAAPTTATTRKPPATTATTRAAGGSTSSTGRPVAAPPVTTATGPNGAVKNGGKLGDPAGDTFVDGTQDPIKEGRADIVRSRAVYEPDRITFVVQVDEPSDPSKDERWASDSTFAKWEIDTNGDGTADFDVQYYIDQGTYGGAVSKLGAAEPEIVCEVGTATYGPEGYSVTIPAHCLGDPASFQYRATMYYDTNPKDENADVVSDVAPNGGLSIPISRGA